MKLLKKLSILLIFVGVLYLMYLFTQRDITPTHNAPGISPEEVQELKEIRSEITFLIDKASVLEERMVEKVNVISEYIEGKEETEFLFNS